MAFSISGYVLESIRVGQANSSFTQTPDNLISSQIAFDAAYPSSEDEPRTDYLVVVTSEGTPQAGLLVNARFGWTKNEIVDRFGYSARLGRFQPLPGAGATLVGTLASDSNITRLAVRPPVQAAPIPSAPYRLAVGATGSGTTWTISIVATDLGFGTPVAGTVELSLATGNLNWNVADLTTYSGQPVRFQRQQFYDFTDTGRMGLASETLLLNPIPGTGQSPLIRLGSGLYLNPVQIPSESGMLTPNSGYVNWALDTGLLRFNPTDISGDPPVYYDGVLIAANLALPDQSLGSINSPSNIVGLPSLGADLIFRLPSGYQFPQVSYLPTASFTAGQAGVVQVDPDTGDVQFSTADQTAYSGEQVTLFFGDLPIERGISIRFLRTPVNLDGSSSVKDVTAIYSVTNAVWADPIIGSPQVFLPSTPIDDSGYPLVVMVTQGQGTYLSDNFPRLDVSSPPSGLGYYIDLDDGTFHFAERKEQILVPITTPTPNVMLPDPLVLTANLELEIETGPGTGIYTPLTLGQDAMFDGTSGIVSLTTPHGATIAEGTNGSTGVDFIDAAADFITDGVVAGDLLEILSPPSVEGIYTISSVVDANTVETVEGFPAVEVGVAYSIHRSREILADRFFEEVILIDPSTKVERVRFLGAADNSPRLNIPFAYVSSSGFRFGPALSNTFATVVLVPDNSSFTAPPTGTVQISEDTGDLNFAAADLGTDIFWMRELEINVDYQLSAGLGLIQFTDRMLALEEVIVTYTTAPPSTDPPTVPGPPVQEYGRFLIRKEITQPHPAPTSTLTFNVAGLDVASDPSPAVFRGGRPQRLGIQCVVDTATSVVNFLADNQITDALPHGATVDPNERVYIDYYVTQAVGGENTITVLNPPILTSVVNINELDANGDPNNQFTVHGDHTASFPSNYLMRVENEQVYLIGTSSYDVGDNETTVTLAGNQVFQDSFTEPTIYVSSGPTPITSAPLAPSYFASEIQTFESTARGSKTFKVAGNRTLSYRTGTMVLFTDGGASFSDFLQVSGASYEAETNRTTVMLTSGSIRQYVAGSQLLLYSVRPLFEPPTTETQTSDLPALTQPYTVYRKVLGEPGVILTSPQDYTINDSGRVVFTAPLQRSEEFSIFYLGLEIPQQLGVNLRASYTCQVAPNGSNGLLGQLLSANYSIWSPDSFYYRVETMTNFRGEYAAEISASASSGSSGPQTQNASQPELFEQGRPSLYFNERHLANQDIIARSSLLFYNTSVNLLEQYLRALDGRVVGNNDGLLLFDGTTGDTHPPGPVSNQIDDTIQVSPAPYTITYPPFAATSIGTFKKYYLPGPISRFYPTSKNFFGVSAVTPSTVAGDEVLDTGSTNVTLVANLHTRLAWAVTTESSEFSGDITLKVDNADGSEDYARPPFLSGMKCVVQLRDGTFINDTTSPITIGSVAPTELTISGLAGVVPAGSTVYRSPIDDSVQTGPDELVYYSIGRDYSFQGENGQVLYVQDFLGNTPLKEEQALSGTINLSNTLVAPLKSPALYGGIEDDDGDLSFPVQTPDPNSELNGYLYTEDTLIDSPSGIIRGLTTAPFVGTGDLDALRLTITSTGGNFPAPVPKVYDLIRILDGINGPSRFVRVVSVGVDFVTVGTAFASVDTGFTFEVAVSGLTVTGTGAVTSTTTTLDDVTSSFLSEAAVGQTVVFTSGGNLGERRQITEIFSDNSLEFTPAALSPSGMTYRIDNSLATYGGTPNDYLQSLDDTLVGEIALYPAEQTYLLDFLDQVFTDITTGAAGQTTIGLPTFTDASATFLFSGVTVAYFVYIETGADAGFYRILSVDSETQLTMGSNFPATLAGISYRVVKLFGVSQGSVATIFAMAQGLSTLGPSASAFRTLVTTPVLVAESGFPNIVTAPVDAQSFARAVLESDLDARDAEIDARIAAIPGSESSVESVLSATDKLYDKRYTWIDARINLESGLVVQQATSVANRVKAQQDHYNQLIKLLAVEEA